MVRGATTLFFGTGTLLAGLLAVGCGSEEPNPQSARDAEATPLNVVFITLDTTRVDALSLYGNERNTTPELDRVAERGAVFEQAYTSQPSTLPSHATMMTGRLPFAHGARANAGYVLPYDNETLAEVFSRHGYVTAAEIAAPVIGRQTQLDQGFQTYRDLQSFDVRRKHVNVLRDGEFERQELAERDAMDITRRGLEFLRRNAGSPFFLWLHYFDAHSFYLPPAPWNSRFSDVPYYAEIHFADYNIGRIFEELRKLGIVERTLVVVVSDHGEGLEEHRELTHSFFVYDTTMRVPLVFVLPGTIPSQLRLQQPVRTADIAPTVLDLVGLPPLSDIDGVSLVPVLLGRAVAPQLDIYGESFEPLSMFGTNVLRFMRRGKWKYIHKVNPELFDLSEDPSELVNLASRHPEIVAAMRRDLADWVLRGVVERTDNRVVLDDEMLGQLQALGYVGEGAPSGFSEADDLAVLRGDDPVVRSAEIEIYSKAFAALKAELPEQAIEYFDQLYATNPESLPVIRGLIQALEGDARLERAPGLLEKAKQLEPDSPNHYIRAGEIQRDLGNLEAAERELRQALVVDPCAAVARVVFAEMLREWGRIGDQKELLEEGIELCDEDIDLRNDLAYLLATSRDDSIRDGAHALQLARQVVKDAESERPDYLDTLACAWAEVGNFRKAVRNSQRALDLIESRDMDEEIMSEYRNHLQSLQDGRRIRSGSS